jgi:predicted DNA-binding protein
MRQKQMISDNNKSATLNVRLTPALKARFEKLAAQDKRTLSNYVEIILSSLVDELEKKAKPTRR